MLASTAWGFEPYFSDAAGSKLGRVWEGQQIYIAIKDPDKGACGIAEFRGDLTIFDWKTGAYLYAHDVLFRELGGIGSGLYFWVTDTASNSKVPVQVGSRRDFTDVPSGQTHVLGTVSPAPTGVAWAEGAWEYVDENVSSGATPVVLGTLPQDRKTAREDFKGEDIKGRLENNDTLVLIVADQTDERNVDQDQVKIVDTVAELSVPAWVDYGCGASCANIVDPTTIRSEALMGREEEGILAVPNAGEMLWRLADGTVPDIDRL